MHSLCIGTQQVYKCFIARVLFSLQNFTSHKYCIRFYNQWVIFQYNILVNNIYGKT